jgi:hypothetical protein
MLCHLVNCRMQWVMILPWLSFTQTKPLMVLCLFL